MKILTITRFAVLISLTLAQVAVAQQTGRVKISSLNPSDELVPFLNVIIEGNGLKRTLETIGVGDEYENGGLIDLPPGIYQITTNNCNYYPFQRAPFRVEAGTTLQINVCPVLEVLMQALVIDQKRGMHDEYQFARRPKDASFRVAHTSTEPLDLLIRYDRKHFRRGITEFTGNRIVGGAMATHNAIAIYAHRFRYNQRTSLLEAEGGVILEDGTSRSHLKRLVVSFKNGVPEILRK
jgi:hypothetical protein